MIEPVAFRVVLRPDAVVTEREVKTDSGLIVKVAVVTDEVMERNATTAGTVVAIGPDVYKNGHSTTLPFGGLQVGLRVSYARYAGKFVKDPENGEELLLVNDDDIVAILRDKSDADTVVAS